MTPQNEEKCVVGHTDKLQGYSQDETYWINRPKDDPRHDWNEKGETWIDSYVKSANHPHRALIIDALKTFMPIKSLLEIGCSAAPNILRIEKEKLEISKIVGLDVNKDSIERARQLLPQHTFSVGNIKHLLFDYREFDVVLLDAVLMYVDNYDIESVIWEIVRIVDRGIIVCDWFAEQEEIDGIHWKRNYKALFENYGFKVEMKPFTKETWSNEQWIKNGKLFVCRLA